MDGAFTDKILTEAARFLGLTLPTTKNQVKSAFRRRSREEHPDVSKAKDASDRFNKLVQCFALLDAASSDVVEEFAVEILCSDGTPVANCGNGLGPTTNGATCGSCSGKGFTVYTADACQDCWEWVNGLFPLYKVTRVWEYKCWVCKGTGMCRDHTCGNCKGTGKTKDNRKGNHCPSCKGTRRAPRGHKNYDKCLRCKGCGEIPMWNPVLQKGFLPSIT
jgi:DnaJ-class molecular chaperone